MIRVKVFNIMFQALWWSLLLKKAVKNPIVDSKKVMEEKKRDNIGKVMGKLVTAKFSNTEKIISATKLIKKQEKES